MEDIKQKIERHFYDKEFAADIAKMFISSETDVNIKNTIEAILTDKVALSLLESLYDLAKTENFVVSIPLSNCFFIISELATISQAERDFALNMSIFLSEDADSRDLTFSPVDILESIKNGPAD